MTFSEALEHLAYGRKIRRKEWVNDAHITSNGDRIFFYAFVNGELECLETIDWPDRVFSLSDVMAEDWEYYV